MGDPAIDLAPATWLALHGGDGLILTGDIVVADGALAPFTWREWRAVIKAGLIERYAAARWRRVRSAQSLHPSQERKAI